MDNVGGKHVPVVVHTLRPEDIEPSSLFGAGCRYSVPLDKWNLTDAACDVVYAQGRPLNFELPGTLTVLMDARLAGVGQRACQTPTPLECGRRMDIPARTPSWGGPLGPSQTSPGSACTQGTCFDAQGQMREDVIWVVETDNAHAMVDLRTTVLALDVLGLSCASGASSYHGTASTTSAWLCKPPPIWADP